MSPSNKKMAQALRGAPTSIMAFVVLMEKLIGIFTLEAELVSHRRTKEHAELLKEKQRAAMDYRASMKAIAAQPDVLKKLPPEARDVLRDVAGKLAAAADNNARVLRAAVDATQKLIHNIIAAVRNEAMPRQNYKNSAKAHLQLGNYSPTCQPIAVRRSV